MSILIFGSCRDPTASPEITSGRHCLALFLKAELNDNKLTVIPDFWRNTRIFLFRIIELGAGMETLMVDIIKVRTERLSLGILETNTV